MRCGIVVEAHMDAAGGIIVRPKSDRWAKRFCRRVVKNGGPGGVTVYLQSGFVSEDFIQFDVPKRYRKDLLHGRVDPWIVGHWYGWDAHTIVE